MEAPTLPRSPERQTTRFSIVLFASIHEESLLGFGKDGLNSEARAVVLAGDRIPANIPGGWAVERFDASMEEAFRQDYIGFLERFGQARLADGDCFDDRFRTCDGWSLWQLGGGAERHRYYSDAPELRLLWLLDNKLKQCHQRGDAIDRVVLADGSSKLKDAVARRAERHGLTAVDLAGTKLKTIDNPFAGAAAWRRKGWVAIAKAAVRTVLRRRAGRKLDAMIASRPSQPSQNSIVMVSTFNRRFRSVGGKLHSPFWHTIAAALEERLPNFKIRYLTTASAEKGGRDRLPETLETEPFIAPQMAPSIDGFRKLSALPGAVLRHVSRLTRLTNLEREPEYHAAMEFAGTNVGAFLIPSARESVMRGLEIENFIDATAQAIRVTGKARAILICEEFYQRGMYVTAAAKRLGIPSIGIQHGTIMPSHYTYVLPPSQVKNAPLCERFAAYGDYAREVLTEVGAFPYERVWPVGSPSLDGHSAPQPDRAAARRALGIAETETVLLVTVATEGTAWFPRAVESVFRVAADQPGWRVCVKLHPNKVTRDWRAYYQDRANSHASLAADFYDDRLHELIRAADVVIGASSTTLLEAMLGGRATVMVNFSGEPDRYPYASFGGAIAARNPAELAMATKQALKDAESPKTAQARADFLRRHCGATIDGRAAETLADHIVEFIGDS